MNTFEAKFNLNLITQVVFQQLIALVSVRECFREHIGQHSVSRNVLYVDLTVLRASLK